VVEYVMADGETRELLGKTLELLSFFLPRCEREGKSYLTIAVGCTGGRHRSVVLGDALATTLRKRLGVRITAVHRDVDRGFEKQDAPRSASDSLPSEVELQGALSAPPPDEMSAPIEGGTR
jgi:UPF0042 nucleotide-binding protein